MATAAIVGPGNIGTDLMYKLLRSPHLEPRWMIGVDPASEGLKRAEAAGLEASAEGVDWLLAQPELPDIVFEATSAYVHVRNYKRYRGGGDPGGRSHAGGPSDPTSCRRRTSREHVDEWNVNMVTCGGQATIPMVHAVSRVVPVEYAEIVATVSSASAGPGTRQNIDEFTQTTSKAVEVIGGATRGKAIIILNPAEPPLIMRDTVFCRIPLDADTDAIAASIRSVAAEVAEYVPGYRLIADPQFDVPFGDTGAGRVAVFLEVEGAGDFLPPYAGNLDIMTAAATKVGNEIAKSITAGRTAVDAVMSAPIEETV